LMAGVVAALLGLVWAVHVAGILTALSGLLAWAQMDETLPRVHPAPDAVPLETSRSREIRPRATHSDALRGLQ